MPYLYPTKGGSASEAEKLKTPCLIELSGDVTGSAEFDGSGDITIETLLNVAGGGTLTNDDIGFGLALEDGKLILDLANAVDDDDFEIDTEGKLKIKFVDVNVLYVPEGTDLILGG